MSKFDVGDRVRSKEDASIYLTIGRTYTVTHVQPGSTQVEVTSDTGLPTWLHDHRFELYAKAGEFVAGDTVMPINVIDGPWTVIAVLMHDEGQMVSLSGDYGRLWPSRGYRLAAPEEIASPEAKPIASVRPEGVEILAADFDFSTIKKGDVAVIRFEVLADGLTHEYSIRDHFVKVYQPDFGPYYFRPNAFHSVIPAPKPKALRERAIEAAKSVVDDRDYLDDIVDAVLAEIEKGQ